MRYKKRERKMQKRQESENRIKEYQKLSVKEKIAKLDAKLGIGNGAMKQRAKLAKLL